MKGDFVLLGFRSIVCVIRGACVSLYLVVARRSRSGTKGRRAHVVGMHSHCISHHGALHLVRVTGLSTSKQALHDPHVSKSG